MGQTKAAYEADKGHIWGLVRPDMGHMGLISKTWDRQELHMGYTKATYEADKGHIWGLVRPDTGHMEFAV